MSDAVTAGVAGAPDEAAVAAGGGATGDDAAAGDDAAGGAAPTGVPHEPQKAVPSLNDAPQFPQNAIAHPPHWFSFGLVARLRVPVTTMLITSAEATCWVVVFSPSA
ncbi:MAG: hypothetical protein WBC04_15420 [Candidatus Acidiferrales bacterium]